MSKTAGHLSIRFPERLFALFAFVFSWSLTGPAQPIVPTNGQVFMASTVLVPGAYNLPRGVAIGASGVTLDLNGASLIGTSFTNYGVSCLGHDNIMIKNGAIRGYYYGVRVENGTNVQCSTTISLQTGATPTRWPPAHPF